VGHGRQPVSHGPHRENHEKGPKAFGPAGEREVDASTAEGFAGLGIDLHYLDANGEFVENVKRLVTAKNAWAADMRDIAVNGAVPVSDQQTIWHDYMKRAGLPA
jgi:hypothetical protein